MSDTTENGIVVLLSGGLDSSVLLHHLRREAGTKTLIHALGIHYGQRHARELDAARYQADAARAQFHEIDLWVLGAMLQPGSTLIAGAAAVPDLDSIPEAARNQPPTYVPNRNMMLLSIAAAFAEAQDTFQVYYGAQAQDEYGYWDCTREFLQRINAVLALNRKEPVQIHAPFVDWSKADIVQRGQALGVDFAHTWSCYRGESKPCGECPTCVERANAFAACGVRDPLQASCSPGMTP